MTPPNLHLRSLSLWLGLLAGCSVHTVNARPEAPLTLPERYQVEAGERSQGRWWLSFDDPELDRLIRSALEQSPRMRGAWARLRQAEALSDVARAARWPTAGLNANASYRENFFPPFGTIDQRTYSLSMPVSYELDVWNKYGAGVDGAAASVRASRSDVEALAVSLAAEVAEAYYDLVSARAQQGLLDSQRETNLAIEELLEQRYERGVLSAVDVYQQRQQRLSTEAQIALAQGNIALAEARLAVLLARPRGALPSSERDQLPALPALSGLGVPADLLSERPDVRAVRDRIVAQDAQLAQAIAARLPTFVVNGSLSYSASSPADLFEALLKSLSASVSAPVLDGGAQSGQVRRQRALLEEAIANYAQVLLTALSEVDTALAREGQQESALVVLRLQKETADTTLRETRMRYEQGLSDYVPVLNALVSQQTIERSLLDAERQRLSARIQLCRALGGTWTAALSRPEQAPRSGSARGAAAAP